MKAVLMSTQPRWCELIASFKKTIEVRKTKPRDITTPFKVYIYCTKNKRKRALHTYINSGYGRREFGIIGQWRSGKEVVDVNAHLPAYRYNSYLAEGKIIGEFVCDGIIKNGWISNPSKADWRDSFNEGTCLTNREAYEYTKGELHYEWHISELVIYDKPRELSEFTGLRKTKFGYEPIKISRPPQSWCYVYERERGK